MSEKSTKTSTTTVPAVEEDRLINSVEYVAEQADRNADEEREHRKTRLVGALRIFSDLGFDEGVAGHITARDPEHPDSFWVNPYAVHFSQTTLSDLVLVTADGKVRGGRHHRVNKAAFAIHHAIHCARPEVVSAAHAHTLHGRAWSTLGRPIAPIVQEACAFWNNHVVYSDYDGIVFEATQAASVAAALGEQRAVTLMHHGNITVGNSVEEAAWWFITLERCCQIQLMAEATGTTPREMPPEQAKIAARQFGSPNKARLSFEMLYRVAQERHPDMLH